MFISKKSLIYKVFVSTKYQTYGMLWSVFRRIAACLSPSLLTFVFKILSYNLFLIELS